MEVWKKFKETNYSVSSYGNVRNDVRGNLISGAMTKSGYRRVLLRIDNKQKLYYTHQLVAIVFLEHVPCRVERVVDHIDNNRSNNHLSNLQIITQRENASKDRNGGASEYVGVYYLENRKQFKWKAQITINGKNKYLGSYPTEYRAHLAYQRALKNITNHS